MATQCAKCGTQQNAGSDICPMCGEKIPQDLLPPAPQKAAVIAATLLPIFGVICFALFAAAIAIAGLMLMRQMHSSNRQSPPAVQTISPAPQIQSPPSQTVVITRPVIPPAPTFSPTTAPIPSPLAADPTPSPPPQPLLQSPLQPPPPPATMPVYTIDAPPAPPFAGLPAPSITSFEPAIVPPGQPLTIHGENLYVARSVALIDSRGARIVSAKITSKADDHLVITVPDVPFADHGIFLAVYAPGGVCVLVDEHLGNTPWGTDGHLHHTAVNVRTDDEITVQDHMVVFAMPQSTVSMGDDCVGFFSNNVTLKSVGKHCVICYVDPLHQPESIPTTRLLKKPSIELAVTGEPFRVKPAPPDADQ